MWKNGRNMKEMKLPLFADDITVETPQCMLQSNAILIQKLFFLASFYAYSSQITQLADNCKWERERVG